MHGPLSTRRELWLRAKTHWLLKALCFTAYMTLFMAAYFLLLRHPLSPVMVMPLTFLDRLIPFAPWSLVLYLSLWFYISLVPSLLLDTREARGYLLQVTLLSLTGFGIFLLQPTAVPVPDLSGHPSASFLKAVDAAGNACPSLHVAFAVLTAVDLSRLMRHLKSAAWLHVLSLLWCLGILYSTLATKQHVAWDLYAGAILGLGIGLIVPGPRFLSPST
jgi:hypothetical protein